MTRFYQAALAAIAMTSLTVMAQPSWAQGNQDYTVLRSYPNAITGGMNIKFGTRTLLGPAGEIAIGAADLYATDLWAMDSINFQGGVRRLPQIPGQEGSITYDLVCKIRNPKDAKDVRGLGKWAGALRLDGNGRYYLGEPPEGQGSLKIATVSIGNAGAFQSEFKGTLQGRIPEKTGIAALAAKLTKTYVRYVGGKAMRVTVKGLDPMAFENVTLAQGPREGYPVTKTTGSIDYDPELGNWYVDIKTTYVSDGVTLNDRYSGTIRWNEDANRKSNGIGWYDVNVRINEKAASDQEVFVDSSSLSDDAFFSSEAKVPGFSGKINYVDTFDGDTVTDSKVTYLVEGHEISKIQTVNFAKILLLMVGPFNDE
jgi:hypothetical protein